jgi:hypothetical protein
MGEAKSDTAHKGAGAGRARSARRCREQSTLLGQHNITPSWCRWGMLSQARVGGKTHGCLRLRISVLSDPRVLLASELKYVATLDDPENVITATCAPCEWLLT